MNSATRARSERVRTNLYDLLLYKCYHVTKRRPLTVPFLLLQAADCLCDALLSHKFSWP
jgi:hypothetical protein